MDTWSEYRDVEAAFMAGVRANLSGHAAALARERTGVRGARAADLVEDSERESVLDWAAVHGVGAPAADGPVNAELWAPIRRGRRTVLFAGVKSFAASAAFARAGLPPRPGAAERAAHYLRRARARAGGRGCVCGLFWPDGWPDGLDGLALSTGRDDVILCRRGDARDGELWVETRAAGALGWFTWLALTPMSRPARTARCLEILAAQRELRVPDGVLRIGDLAEKLHLPLSVARPAVDEVCRRTGGQFRVGRSGRTEYVQRVRMR